MKRLFLFLAIVILSTNICFSQDNTVYKNSLEKMLIASGAEANYKVAITQMVNMMQKQRNDIPVEFWNKLSEEFLKSSMTELLDLLVPVYQKQLTVAELDELTAFYHSPIGKKFAEKSPLIMQGAMQAGQQWGMKIGQQIAEKLKEKYN